MKLFAPLLLSISVLSFLPGCVVWEIRDELRGANKQLGEVQASLQKLDETNQSLVDTNKALAQTNKSIDEVQQGLARIDTTNGSLDGVDKRLAVLNPIQASLTRLDVHLAALRRTIGRIDSVIPFLDLGSGEVVTDAPVAAPEPAEGAKPEPTEAGTKREVMVGAWLSQFPDRRTALIIMADGHYVQAVSPSTPQELRPAPERGLWKRTGEKSLSFTPEPPVGTGADGKPLQSAFAPWTLTIVAQSGRSLTAESNGQVVVFSRP